MGAGLSWRLRGKVNWLKWKTKRGFLVKAGDSISLSVNGLAPTKCKVDRSSRSEVEAGYDLLAAIVVRNDGSM